MGPNEIFVDQNQRHQVAVIPFDEVDQAGDNTETDTGFNTGLDKFWLAHAFIEVVDIDAGETIDVGTDAGSGDDPNGFIAAISLATARNVKATLLTGAVTLGALLQLANTTVLHEGYISPASDGDITWTLSAGADTAAGFIYLPYVIEK
jgi:hypothetical protein